MPQVPHVWVTVFRRCHASWHEALQYRAVSARYFRRQNIVPHTSHGMLFPVRGFSGIPDAATALARQL